MQFGSVCSGIEAASVAWAPLGWKAAWLAEIEPFPCAVLAHHYPSVPNLGDMTTIARRVLTGEVSAPDVFCGGTPCQAFSAADVAPSMGAANPTAVAFNFHKSGNKASSLGVSVERVDCLRAFEKSPMAVQPAAGMQVRRLTPTEAERLQGFPDGYTAIPWRNKPADQCPDGPRYRALGNSWAVPNVTWIGRRIQAALRNS